MQVLNGFVKIHRKLLQWGWYQDNVVKGVFLHLLLTASYQESAWMGRTIKRGQVIVGIQKMADELGFSRQQVRTAMDKLLSTNEITTETTNRYTIVTVVNWEDYQSLEEISTNKITNTLTNRQPADCVNKVLTNEKGHINATNKLTNKKGVESLAECDFEEFEEEKATNTLTNKQPTDNQQATTSKEYKE